MPEVEHQARWSANRARAKVAPFKPRRVPERSFPSDCEECRRSKALIQKNMRFRTHFIRRKSAPYLPSLPQSRKGSISVSVYAEPTHVSTVMSGRDSTISSSDASMAVRSGRDYHHRYVRRPNLTQILSDEAPPPWTLEAFTSYAARNLCLENIEFIQDARRYKTQYQAAMSMPSDHAKSQPHQRPGLDRFNSFQVEKLKEMWTRLMLTYIAPSSPKEINLTSDIRSGLLPHNKQMMAPSPDLLEPAVKKIEELIEDSILFSFLNEVQMSESPSVYFSSGASREQLGLDPTDKLIYPPSIQEMISPVSENPSPSPFSPVKRSPKHGHFVFPNIDRSSSHRGSPVPAMGAALPGSAANSIAPTLSEDSSSVISPAPSQGQRTPPRTPPGHDSISKMTSPKQGHERWKRMSQKFGFSRKSGTHLKEVAEDHPPLPE